MEIRESVSQNLVHVVSTLGTTAKKPNTIHMAVSDELIIEALKLFKAQKNKIDIETGLVRFELVAVYEDGKSEIEVVRVEGIEKEVVDLEFEKIGETLETAVDEAKDLELYSEEKKDDTTPFEDYEKEETEKVDE